MNLSRKQIYKDNTIDNAILLITATTTTTTTSVWSKAPFKLLGPRCGGALGSHCTGHITTHSKQVHQNNNPWDFYSTFKHLKCFNILSCWHSYNSPVRNVSIISILQTGGGERENSLLKTTWYIHGTGWDSNWGHSDSELSLLVTGLHQLQNATHNSPTYREENGSALDHSG